jgi:hypothetical protein
MVLHNSLRASQIFVNLIVFNESDPLIVSVTLFLFLLTAMVEWDILEWQAVMITDFPTPQTVLTFNFVSKKKKKKRSEN